MTAMRSTISEINALDRASLVAALGPVFEMPPWIVERAWEECSYVDLRRLHARLHAIMDAVPVVRQGALIRAHPDFMAAPVRECVIDVGRWLMVKARRRVDVERIRAL